MHRPRRELASRDDSCTSTHVPPSTRALRLPFALVFPTEVCLLLPPAPKGARHGLGMLGVSLRVLRVFGDL